MNKDKTLNSITDIIGAVELINDIEYLHDEAIELVKEMDVQKLDPSQVSFLVVANLVEIKFSEEIQQEMVDGLDPKEIIEDILDYKDLLELHNEVYKKFLAAQ